MHLEVEDRIGVHVFDRNLHTIFEVSSKAMEVVKAFDVNREVGAKSAREGEGGKQ